MIHISLTLAITLTRYSTKAYLRGICNDHIYLVTTNLSTGRSRITPTTTPHHNHSPNNIHMIVRIFYEAASRIVKPTSILVAVTTDPLTY